MTMRKMTYKEFTDLNTVSNLTDFINYLQDRNVMTSKPLKLIKPN